jgi:heptosyltransferase II
VLSQNWLGDALFSTPALRALRARFPQAYIACLAPRRVHEALSHNPHLNEVIAYDERASLVSLFEPLRVWSLLKRRGFDTAIFFHRSRSKAFLARVAGIRRRIGYARGGRGWLLTQAVPVPDRPLHKIDAFLYLLDKAGIPSAGRHLEVEPTPQEEASAAKLLSAEGVDIAEDYAVVHAGGNWDLKRWPAAHFARWISLFLSKNPGWKIVLCGSASEKELARDILERAGHKDAVSICGKTGLGELAALLRHARFVLSNDSGPIHVAAAQRTRILGLYGPTSSVETGPVSAAPVRVLWKDVGCRVPCYFRSCDWRACMELLTPEHVLEQSEALLRS